MSLSGAVAVVIAGLLTFDLRPFLPDLDQSLSRTLGQNVVLEGPVGVDVVSGVPWLVFRQVRLNSQPALALGARPISGEISEVWVEVDPLSLVRRQLRLKEVRLVGGNLSLLANRSPIRAEDPAGGVLDVAGQRFQTAGFYRLSAIDTRLSVVERGQTVFDLMLGEARAAPGEIGLDVEAVGQLRGQPVSFRGRSGPLLAVLSGHRIFFDGEFQSASAKLSVAGTLGDLAALGVDLQAEGDATELNDVALLFGFDGLARNTPTTVTATIQGTRDHFVLENIDAGFGRGDLSGRLEIRQGQTFQIVGNLHSELLDLDALEGVSWTRPPTRIFSTDPLPTKWLRSGRVDVSYEAENIVLANTLMRNGQVQVYLTDGVLTANPIRAEFLDGMFDSSLTVNARGYPYFRSEINLVNFDLGHFLSEVDMMGSFEAILDFGFQIEGEGDSVASMFANSKGQTNLLMGSGRLSDRAVRALGGQVVDQLRPLSADQEFAGQVQVDLTCAVSRFDIDRGVAKSRAFLIQTADTITTGRGEVNLGTESLNLQLAPRPKDPTRLSRASDLRVGGSFVHPVFSVEKDNLSRGIAGSLGRFALVRERDVELLPLIDERASADNACIQAFMNANELPRGKATIYDDPNDIPRFDFRRASKRK
ncbi:MAG: AsmA family protein [Alphaproteobacteria bacterium]|nr:MAG: AsmA family protein [Alphaproteobacteria bacterium]